MSSQKKENKERARVFAKDVLKRIEQLIAEHNSKVAKFNQDIQKNDRIHKVVAKKGSSEDGDNFYKYAEDAAEKLSILNKKLATAQKIKKDRRNNFENKIATMIAHIKELVQEETVKLVIDHWLVKLAQEMGQQAEEVTKSLSLLEKESKGFCFGGDENTSRFVEKGLMDLIGYGQFWQLLPRCSPLIQREIQDKYLSLEYEESIFNDIDKMVIGMWPEPEIIEVQVQRIVEKVVMKEAEKSMMAGTSMKEELERRELQDRNDKLTKENQFEKNLREAHEILIGLGRSQNIAIAIDIYLNIPEINQSEARQSLKTETELKINPLICNILGCLYEQGKYIGRDLNKACEYYIKSASVQDPQGMYKIAKFLQKRMVNPVQLFEQGYQNREQQIKDAIQHYEKAAEKGHLDAITDLGHIYENGIRKEEIRSDHSAVSQSEVSNSQAEDFIIEPNLQHAAKYYLLAKKQDFPRALNNLGAMYVRMGDKLSQTIKGSNIERGIKYLKRATELKYGKAFLNLGKCYEKGLGVKKNFQKAKSLYIEGAQLQDSQCKLQFIKCMINYEVEIQGKIDVKIHEYLRQILINEPENAQALHMMGIFQEKGIGVEKNAESAYYYVHKAAKLDHTPSLIKLGDYYYSGFHIGKDITRAKMCYEKAATKGNSQGFINLGLLYQKGLIQLDSKADEKQIAINYFLQAAKLGNPNALLFLSKEGASPEQMKQAAELGSPQALKMLAKTGTTAETEGKSFEQNKSRYKNLVNKFINEANKLPEISRREQKKLQAPASPRLRQMMIYSPRERPHATSNIFTQRIMSPKPREGYRSQEYYRR